VPFGTGRIKTNTVRSRSGLIVLNAGSFCFSRLADVYRFQRIVGPTLRERTLHANAYSAYRKGVDFILVVLIPFRPSGCRNRLKRLERPCERRHLAGRFPLARRWNSASMAVAAMAWPAGKITLSKRAASVLVCEGDERWQRFVPVNFQFDSMITSTRTLRSQIVPPSDTQG